MNIIQEQRKRTFQWRDSKGINQQMIVNYTLVKKDGQLLNVINQNGYSVEKDSECFDFFNKN